MSRYIEVTSQSYKATHTDHTDEIAALRSESQRLMRETPFEKAQYVDAILNAAFETAAALLEVHDATGISLDDWVGPRELVESCLTGIGYPDGTFLPNHV